ncbi:TetR family transcriptional regulator [Paraburkholderia aspalathi]|nr:TetR family transcriptional regulator [Paraburkholderia aspalathi]
MKKVDRKDAILNGVIELLAVNGIEGVTHRAVDEIVGLPQGSTTYYFPKKMLLLKAASEHLSALLSKDCEELQVGFAERVAKQGMEVAVTYVGDELVNYADSTRHLFLARIELTMASARREELAGIGEQLTAAARRPIEFFLHLISDGKTEEQIQTCAGLIDGITLMYVNGQGPKPTADQIEAVFKAVL